MMQTPPNVSSAPDGLSIMTCLQVRASEGDSDVTSSNTPRNRGRSRWLTVFDLGSGTLVDLSKRADMVVVGCRGQGAVARALLGSVSSGLIHRAQCPVAVIHDEDPLTQRSPQAPVVVGIDGSPTSELATAIAFDEASRREVGLVALHAWSDMGPLKLQAQTGRRSNGKISKSARKKFWPSVFRGGANGIRMSR
jgi:nucleotide-binding universal stress UspA family protein